MKKTIMGNHAVSYGVRASEAKVISAYPITPQTHVVELLSEMCANGEIDAKFIKVESEHSAMAACVGASAAGSRAFTATSSQGLLLMTEMLHWAVGSRLPIVLANINRAIGPPWSIWTDQNDSLSMRDVGWVQIYCESNQETQDTIPQAFKIAEQLQLPVMLVLDAFFLSHTYEIVDILEAEEVRDFLPPYKPEIKLDVNEPHSFGNLASPDYYMELRYMIEEAMGEARELIKKTGKEFGERFGREYGLVHPYRCDDAETILVCSGTVASTVRAVIDQMREEGIKIGSLKMRVFRPFPFEEVREILGSAKKVAVLDRNISFGGHGIFFQEVKSALYGFTDIPVVGYILGLGGRDVTPEVLREVADKAINDKNPETYINWIGVKK
ncbi:MAG: pyruvate ferredoxin oxidoreductase [Candidatus Latescibacteria bacterium]|nr:pyruvate ferredoxin oxidoreductase [bacterium]MBD3423826.1 pyruvate ferredoxin oxidoreductase [Candidatus Latescibacterota bacterium]